MGNGGGSYRYLTAFFLLLILKLIFQERLAKRERCVLDFDLANRELSTAKEKNSPKLSQV